MATPEDKRFLCSCNTSTEQLIVCITHILKFLKFRASNEVDWWLWSPLTYAIYTKLDKHFAVDKGLGHSSSFLPHTIRFFTKLIYHNLSLLAGSLQVISSDLNAPYVPEPTQCRSSVPMRLLTWCISAATLYKLFKIIISRKRKWSSDKAAESYLRFDRRALPLAWALLVASGRYYIAI